MVRVHTSAGRRRVSGGPKLKGTQSYTRDFGATVARAHSRHTIAMHLKACRARATTFWELRPVDTDAIIVTWNDAKLSAVQRFLARRMAQATATA